MGNNVEGTARTVQTRQVGGCQAPCTPPSETPSTRVPLYGDDRFTTGRRSSGPQAVMTSPGALPSAPGTTGVRATPNPLRSHAQKENARFFLGIDDCRPTSTPMTGRILTPGTIRRFTPELLGRLFPSEDPERALATLTAVNAVAILQARKGPGIDGGEAWMPRTEDEIAEVLALAQQIAEHPERYHLVIPARSHFAAINHLMHGEAIPEQVLQPLVVQVSTAYLDDAERILAEEAEAARSEGRWLDWGVAKVKGLANSGSDLVISEARKHEWAQGMARRVLIDYQTRHLEQWGETDPNTRWGRYGAGMAAVLSPTAPAATPRPGPSRRTANQPQRPAPEPTQDDTSSASVTVRPPAPTPPRAPAPTKTVSQKTNDVPSAPTPARAPDAAKLVTTEAALETPQGELESTSHLDTASPAAVDAPSTSANEAPSPSGLGLLDIFSDTFKVLGEGDIWGEGDTAGALAKAAAPASAFLRKPDVTEEDEDDARALARRILQSPPPTSTYNTAPEAGADSRPTAFVRSSDRPEADRREKKAEHRELDQMRDQQRARFNRHIYAELRDSRLREKREEQIIEVRLATRELEESLEASTNSQGERIANPRHRAPMPT